MGILSAPIDWKKKVIRKKERKTKFSKFNVGVSS